MQILEQRSPQFERPKASLSIFVTLFEGAKIKLLGNRFKGVSQFNWIGNLLLHLTRRLNARFRTIFNDPTAMAAYIRLNGE
jgi:hypothetical protein